MLQITEDTEDTHCRVYQQGEDIMKIFIFLSFLIFSSMIFLSCEHSSCETGTENSMGVANNCIVFTSCKSDSECKENEYCNAYRHKCYQNICKKEGYENHCGMGKCIIDEYGEDSCQCDEGYKSSEMGRCILMCESDSDCENYKLGSRELPYCDDKYGHCVDYNPNR